MADPVTLGVIVTGLVGAYKAYADYKAAVTKTATKEEQKEPPEKTEPVAKGEQVAPLVKNAIEKYGEAKEQTTLQLFEEDPDTYEEPLKKVLTYLAQRNPAFATELQTLAQQANIQTGGFQGTVNVSGGSTVYGPTAGTNYGTMSGTYSLPDEDTKRSSTD
jgi:hypothetical protein